MSFVAGDKLGPYEVVSRIGVGGMGEVYRASDTRLNREVAIKTSADQFTERFDREARAVAALNHPNICTLYDVGVRWDPAASIPMLNCLAEANRLRCHTWMRVRLPLTSG